MKVSVDTVADAAAIDFCDSPVGRVRSIEIAGVRLDIDESGEAVSLEVLGLRRRMASPEDVVVSVAAEGGEVLSDDHPAAGALNQHWASEPPAAAAG